MVSLFDWALFIFLYISYYIIFLSTVYYVLTELVSKGSIQSFNLLINAGLIQALNSLILKQTDQTIIVCYYSLLLHFHTIFPLKSIFIFSKFVSFCFSIFTNYTFYDYICYPSFLRNYQLLLSLSFATKDFLTNRIVENRSVPLLALCFLFALFAFSGPFFFNFSQYYVRFSNYQFIYL